jgi:hypothetical protein
MRSPGGGQGTTSGPGQQENPTLSAIAGRRLLSCGVVVLGLALPGAAGCRDTEEDLDRYVKGQMRALLADERRLIEEFNERLSREYAEEEQAAQIARYLGESLIPEYVDLQQRMARLTVENRKIERLHERYVAIVDEQRQAFEDLLALAEQAARTWNEEQPEAESDETDEPLPAPRRSREEVNASLSRLARARAAWEEDLRKLCRKYDVTDRD